MTLLIFSGSRHAHAQDIVDDPADTLLPFFLFDDPPIWSCWVPYFPPLFMQYGFELKSFIRSETFSQIRTCFGDLRAIDAIYIRAMQLTNNNTAVTLLLATIAAMDHRDVGFRVPLFQISLPLSGESAEDFDRRVNNLPRQFYVDGPRSPTGDRDKLQHFFGSAFVTFLFESREPAERIGNFIEMGEEAIVISGELDERDERANRQGQDFGLALLKNNQRTPSSFIITQVASQQADESHHDQCTGVW